MNDLIMLKILVFSLIVLLSSTSAQIEIDGQCDPNVEVYGTLDITEFAGTWYEVARAETAGVSSSDCSIINIAQTGDGGITFENAAVNNVLQHNTGTATRDGTTGRFTLTFNEVGASPIDIYVLLTDHINHALAYSCQNVALNLKRVYVWQLSRERSVYVTAQPEVNSILADLGVDPTDLQPIGHTRDFCLPTVPNGEPVIVPGQCSQISQVAPSFDANEFVGLWHEIRSYKSDNVEGTCARANYELSATEGVVNVVNSQVVGQTLRTISGTATIKSSDGSAWLGVSLEVAPGVIEESDLWFVDIQYDDYAIAYSCLDVTRTTKRDFSWVLSKNQNPSTDILNQVGAIIASVPELNPDYYQETQRSPNDCFYMPEPITGKPVVFPGQCDASITAIGPFNLNSFAGPWYEIESYPKELQGQCINYNFQFSAENPDSLRFDFNQVNPTTRLLESYNGVATRGSTDTTGTFEISITVDDIPYTLPLLVIAVDYNDYALLYSCVNLANDERAVWSWKLSKTRQLSPEAAVAIEAAMTSNEVLHEDYFEPVGHQDTDCFHYPILDSNEPVLFPGLCDLDIPISTQPFEPKLFAGHWNDISSYYDWYEGDCVDATFTDTTNGFDILLTQVTSDANDRVLETTPITATVDPDGRPIFSVTVNGVLRNYYILDTDYYNYALIYACENQGNGDRRVWSWQLGREKELDIYSQAAINNTIRNIDVLDHRYYEPRSHSPESCFYFPEVNPDGPTEFRGQCDEAVPVVTDFDVDKYLGTWFDVASYPMQFQDGDCPTATYSRNGPEIVVHNTQVHDQELDTVTGTAVLDSADGSAKLLVTLPTRPSNFSVTSPYWVLDTDYENFALVYSCTNTDDDYRTVKSWILSRDRTVSPEAESRIRDTMTPIDVLEERYFIQRRPTHQSCFYYPELVSGQAMEFRGQCDENINVVQNFDLERYMGTWYDIESYPQDFQDGSCPIANYDLDSELGIVNIENTQVLNQRRNSILGTARLSTTDGSAKFTVSFPIDGTETYTETPYWVLATDYSNYALVYSCSNMDDFNRRVSFWKLSREKYLSPANATYINNLINIENIDVLRQDYFEENVHSDDACFTFPVIPPGEPIVIEGQCPLSTEFEMVTNFDMTEFSGIWHEISRFPSELQNGECASSNFAINNQNTFTLTQSAVLNERLNANIGPAIVSPDGRGIITTFFDGNVVSTNLNLYILGTDNTEYALVYSCRNIDSHSKQIYSWKLSRNSTGFSQEATDKLDEIITKHRDLFEDYYEYTQQSNAACFYYPESHPDLETIQLPGPCDEGIQGVPNFNVESYLGRWNEIERYPGPNQEGTCNRALFEPGTQGFLFDITNTRVLNEDLESTVGHAVLASNDNSGVLDITFVVNGVPSTTRYYVLATNYISYSLLYSCRNLENGYRQVSSWKLSKNTALTAQDNSAINNVINTTPGLQQEYYITSSQSDEDCFYLPEPTIDQALIFRGQCQSITGVQEFDMQRFLGWWHEIERYPTDAASGDCISSQFEQSGNQILAVDTNVFGLTAQVDTSNVTVTNDGRLRRTFSNNEYSDTWVVATDYDSFALVMACENIENEYSRVWSAKYSRTHELTPTAQLVMALTMERFPVLRQQFYTQVNQTEAACFHYPVLTGTRVILPGQCDMNIPVQTNFLIDNYTGPWYQIQRYPIPYESESAECSGKRYTFNETTEVLHVLNWEVIDDELEEIEGSATVNSTDGSARLRVRLRGTAPTVLFVLQTDYISYSFVYSCSNINRFQRTIGAWKLSRTRELTSESNLAINNLMSDRPELYQDYFREVRQHPDCKEPSASFLIKSSIIVILICGILQSLL